MVLWATYIELEFHSSMIDNPESCVCGILHFTMESGDLVMPPLQRKVGILGCIRTGQKDLDQ